MEIEIPDDVKTLIDVWFDMEPESNEEANIMHTWAKLFEAFVLDKNSTMTPQDRINNIVLSNKVEDLYWEEIIKNQLFFAKIHEQLLGIGLSYNPSVRRNDRYAIKVAHILYPGNNNKSLRDFAVSQVKKKFSKKLGEKRQRQVRSMKLTTQKATSQVKCKKIT